MGKKLEGKNDEKLKKFFNALSTDLHDKCDFASLRLANRSQKRARYDNPAASDRAVAVFNVTNNDVGQYQLCLNSDTVSDARAFIKQALWSYNTREFNSIQEDIHWEHLLDLWRFGPGASNGTKSTHAVDKVNERWGCTERAEPLVRKLRSCNPYFVSFDSKLKDGGTFVVRGSKLTTVPKNYEIARTISKGPVGNMVLQLAAGEYLSRVLEVVGLYISSQQVKNRSLAWRGSIDGTLVTIDLSQASDRISLPLVQALLPESWYWLLCTIREDETEVDGEWVKLNMISMMGNGFTFPLMTLIILSLVWANRAKSLRSSARPWIDWNTTAVYGDDIIVPVAEYDGLKALLEQCGLVVNTDKSYTTGPFRESCGGDYYNGVDVTPFYVKSLNSDSEVYVAINQILLWCSKPGRPVLWKALTYLRSLIEGPVFVVPEWHNPDNGILASQVSRRYKYLQPSAKMRKLRNEHFAVMLAAGGYLESSMSTEGTYLLYQPRPRGPVKYKVRETRLPKGFLDGSDPTIRSDSERRTVDLIISLIK